MAHKCGCKKDCKCEKPVAEKFRDAADVLSLDDEAPVSDRLGYQDGDIIEIVTSGNGLATGKFGG